MDSAYEVTPANSSEQVSTSVDPNSRKTTLPLMTWFFRITGLVFSLFILLVIYGATLPETRALERSATVDAPILSVFDTLNDLTTYPEWSTLIPDNSGDLAFGQTMGEGASAIWDTGASVGSIELVQASAPDLVLVARRSADDVSMMTYALQERDGQTLIVLLEETEQDGFPYLGRISAKLKENQAGRQMDTSLTRLRAYAENRT